MTQIAGIHSNPSRSTRSNQKAAILSARQWLALLLCGGGALAQANTYPVMALPPGISLVANHYAPMPLSSLFSAAQDGDTAYLWRAGSFFAADFFGGWSEDPTVKQGEGILLFNANGPRNNTVNGTATSPVYPSLIDLNAGFHLLGRPEVGPGTFETITGQSPGLFSYARVYRFDPILGATVPPPFFGNPLQKCRQYTYSTGIWSPEVPVLELGEAAFLELGNQVGAPAAFAVNGISPAEGKECLGNVDVVLTGNGFALGNTDTVFLQSGSTQVPATGIAADLDGFLLHAQFDLTALATGYWDVHVQHGSTTATLPNAFKVNSCLEDIHLQLVGRPLVGVGRLASYQLIVRNEGSQPAANVTVNLTGLPAAGIAVSYPSPQNGVGLSPLADGFTFTIPSVASGSQQSYVFDLTPGASVNGQTFTLLAESSPAAVLDRERLDIQVVSSVDPNDKIGPAGVGAGRFIEGTPPLTYQIAFENKPDATAPAQEVTITDQLDPARFDVQSLALGAMTFGDRVLVPPPGVRTFNADVPYDVDGNPATTEDAVLVRIAVTFDNDTTSASFGKVTWRLRTLDQATHLPPANPLLGFLPPNLVPPAGQGTVSLRVAPHTFLATGATLSNAARIVFDFNAPIDTPAWVNTIDKTAPESAVAALPATQASTSFTVNWSGTDAGAGIALYDIHVSTDGGAYSPFLTGTTATSATFTGQVGHAYAFYSVATDRLGHVEGAPASADATTRIESIDTPASRLGDLIALVRSFHLARGTEQELLAKLQAALNAVSAGRTRVACNQLGAFREGLGELTPRKLTRSQAAQMKAAAARIQALIGCGPVRGSQEDAEGDGEHDDGRDEDSNHRRSGSRD